MINATKQHEKNLMNRLKPQLDWYRWHFEESLKAAAKSPNISFDLPDGTQLVFDPTDRANIRVWTQRGADASAVVVARAAKPGVIATDIGHTKKYAVVIFENGTTVKIPFADITGIFRKVP